jgi:PBP1b-binding outer membrane lipoprotein LpoB
MKKYLLLIFSLIFITNCSATRITYGVKQETPINKQTRIEAEKAKQEAQEFARKCERKTMSDPTECKVITRRRWLF